MSAGYDEALARLGGEDPCLARIDAQDEVAWVLDIAVGCWATSPGRMKALAVLILVARGLSIDEARGQVQLSPQHYSTLKRELRAILERQGRRA